VKKWNLQAIKKEVVRLDLQLKEGDLSFETSVILLSSLVVGTSIKALHKFTGIPAACIRDRSRRLRAGKVWVGGKIDCDEWFEDGGGVAFICDCMVADGIMNRATRKEG
jgi:hypothetical protein